MMMRKITISILFFACIIGNLTGQVSSVEELDKAYLNWYNKDLQSDTVLGTSTNRSIQDLLADKDAEKTVIVAVMDGGVDINHEDLKGKIWVNEDEIPGNNIDDDKNGYVDDVHGWNFLGNSEGKNISYENLEFTRILKLNDTLHPDYPRALLLYEKNMAEQNQTRENINRFEEKLNESKDVILQETGIEVTSMEDLEKIDSENEEVKKAVKFLLPRYANGFSEEILEKIKKHNAKYLDYYLNKDFNPREIIGDDTGDLEDRDYGNPDVTGPDASHGTAVAGIIAARRNNGLGIDGIAPNVKIMSIRTTPQGDERDKDVALGIMYAVDNGADIINMSFGKDLSPHKGFIDKAVKYAEEHDVLLVHAAGNDGFSLDEYPSFPSDRYMDDKEIGTWLSVGASGNKQNKEMAAIFSNYSPTKVDIFAPGVDIISLDTSSTYSQSSGTSLAAPVVSGIAALILSYYPNLTSGELIDLLMETSYQPRRPWRVYIPDLERRRRKKTRFHKLSLSGGIVNTYSAIKKLEEKESVELD